jgi:predicted ester cyclase
MSVEENKALIRRMYELINQGKPYYDLLTPDFVVHGTTRDMSLEENKQFDAVMQAAFADYKMTLHNMIGEGDKVAYQVHIKMAHTGLFMGIAPTGKTVEITNTYILKITDNKISEWWGTAEFNRVIQELGINSNK